MLDGSIRDLPHPLCSRTAKKLPTHGKQISLNSSVVLGLLRHWACQHSALVWNHFWSHSFDE
jgi:hypothetical protein